MCNKGSIENVLLSKEKKEKIIRRVMCFYVYFNDRKYLIIERFDYCINIFLFTNLRFIRDF